MLSQFSASYSTRDAVFHFSVVSICSVHFLTVLFRLSGSFTSLIAPARPIKKEVKLVFFLLVGGSSSNVITNYSSFSKDIFNECVIIHVQSCFVFFKKDQK